MSNFIKTIFVAFMLKLALACGVPVGRCLGGRLASTLVASKNHNIFFSFPDLYFSFFFSFFFFFFSVVCVSHRRSARIKKLILIGAPKRPSRPCWSFWLWQAVRRFGDILCQIIFPTTSDYYPSVVQNTML